MKIRFRDGNSNDARADLSGIQSSREVLRDALADSAQFVPKPVEIKPGDEKYTWTILKIVRLVAPPSGS